MGPGRVPAFGERVTWLTWPLVVLVLGIWLTLSASSWVVLWADVQRARAAADQTRADAKLELARKGTLFEQGRAPDPFGGVVEAE
jgi:hypothetical protein